MKSKVSSPTKSADRHYPPRGMRRETAALYVGLGTTKFDQLIKDGRMPEGVLIDGARIWDRYKLDEACDALLNPAPSTGWGEFK